MNDAEVAKQVAQMVRFIRQEAEEKANEISVSAEEEFNIEKLQIVEAEKKKVRQEYERKEKQIEVRRKIEYSTQLNASRLKILQAQDDLVREMKDAAMKQLQNTSNNQGAYKQLLKDLIVQALIRLKEPAVQIRCRESDRHLVESVVDSAKDEYTSKTKLQLSEVMVDNRKFLPSRQADGLSCAGGIVLATKDGKIVCDNTLDSRLEIVHKQNLPEIRKRLCGSRPRAGA
ncbi:hypothetical protein SELMODRAFT_271490 [Selaginella moellendorffii]|uniref:Uncharacterized protein n=1 Tax=Selaginella moellendorffii TaxID=88036 RepID=D8SDK0_SELML|nr:V-type proton ATPase subunit E [Selaginella moellendorffii]EFJ17636.1 hypothetical protein SELMODRAFT_271490 [Selaginella moellendorffii]|eukprot:XP_002981448.1 V-type proton ATPase subunit E [Selaginella moellendorffii]